MNTKEMLDFILLAGQNTYAGHASPDSHPTRPESRDLRYESGDWLYIDTYLGGEHFAGEEAVFFRGKPVWSMNYCGRVMDKGFSGDFLKAALMTRSAASPLRGQPSYQEDDNEYVTLWHGDMDWFQGEEAIYHDGKKVYECVYHGGRID